MGSNQGIPNLTPILRDLSLFEIASMFVCLDHGTGVIVNANEGAM